MRILELSEIEAVCNYVVEQTELFYYPVHAFFYTQKNTGLRPSELMLLDRFQPVGDEFVQFTPLKNNNLRIFALSDFHPYFEYLITNNLPLDYSFSQRYLSRQFSHYAGKTYYVNNKAISTYLFRHFYVKNLFRSGLSPDEIKTKLGHTNISSTLSYINSQVYTK